MSAYGGASGSAGYGEASSRPVNTPANNPGIDPTNLETTYLCGECNNKVKLSRGDPIRCKECGHRVLYKMRTSRYVQFEAR